jgi:flagellar hook-associated protein 3 FlgL
MRITNRIMQQNAQRSLQARLAAVARAQQEVATGRKILTVSDDPTSATQIMRLDSQLRDIEQYRRTGTAASTRLSSEDTVLKSARDLLARARTLALNAAESPDDPVRKAALTLVQQIQSQLISLGNTRVGNEYIFGGAMTTSPPFTEDGTYVGDSSIRQAQIDGDMTLDISRPGDQVFATAIAALGQLAQELETGTPASIQARIPAITAADEDLLIRQAEVGAHLKQISDTGTILGYRAALAADSRDGLREADPTQAAVEAITAQNALERAYAAIGRIFSTSLLDYLR